MLSRQVFKAGAPLGAQSLVNLDWLKFPFQVTANVDVVSGTASYQIEYTTDDINDVNARWLSLTGPQSASQLLLITTPVVAVRINIASLTGELRMAVLQGTSGG